MNEKEKVRNTLEELICAEGEVLKQRHECEVAEKRLAKVADASRAARKELARTMKAAGVVHHPVIYKGQIYTLVGSGEEFVVENFSGMVLDEAPQAAEAKGGE